MDGFGFQWHLSDRCNQRCAHCYQTDFDARGQLELAAWRAMADRIFGALPDGPISVNLTGGEPLLLADLEALIAHLHGFEQLAEIWILTNGSLADPGRLARLAAFEHLAGFKLSIESSDPAVHDAIRGPGNLAKLQANLTAFGATGKQVVGMVTLGRHNANGIEASAEWARAAGLSGLIFERFVPLGRGRALAEQALDETGWAAAAAAVARAAALDLDAGERAELAGLRAFWLDFGPDADRLRGAACNLGAGSMALMPDGSVLPCRRLPEPVGNLLTEPFEAIQTRLDRYRPAAARGCRALERALLECTEEAKCQGG